MSEEQKNYPKKVMNREPIKEMFAEGAAWESVDRKDPSKRYLGLITITLNPGTYEVKEGDTLKLIGFHNDYKEEGDKAPNYKIRVKQDTKTSSGGYGGAKGGY